MAMRHGIWILSSMVLTGCGGALDGTWIGDVTCQAIPFDMTVELSKDSGKLYTGTGVQERTFRNTSGKTTDEQIEFDIELELESSGGAQDMATDLNCTAEDLVEFSEGGLDPVVLSEGCTPRRFDQWVMSWDGADTIDISDPNGCIGEIERR